MKRIPTHSLDWLLNHEEPDVRYKANLLLLQQNPKSPQMLQIQEEIRKSDRVQVMLSEFQQGKLTAHPYKKWNGAHWLLITLAELNYPAGDESLLTLREKVYNWLLSEEHFKKIKTINGRTRRCASMEANALFSSLSLGLADERTPLFAENLLKWQWPDGGWNCDKRPEAHHSSFWETLMPLRALNLYSQITGSIEVLQAVTRAAEIFLKRHLFKRQSDGELMQPEFLVLHYPTYWYYDILIALKVMTDAGFVQDPRCSEALDLLQQKMLPGGGFPAEARLYQNSKPDISGYSAVSWGGVSKKKPNPWVTVHAWYVLKKTGRFSV